MPLRIVRTQVGSLGVLAHQVSIGLDKTAPTIRAKYLATTPPQPRISAGLYIWRDEVPVGSLFCHKTPLKKLELTMNTSQISVQP